MKVLALILSIFTIAHFATGQITISGIITSIEDGSGLPGVNVVEKGTTNITVSDIDGNYKITLSDTSSILTYAFVGLKTIEIKVGRKPIHDVQMEVDFTQLSDFPMGCYFPLRYTEIGYASGLKYTSIGFEVHNLTPNIWRINFQLESLITYREKGSNEYMDIIIRRYGLFNIKNFAFGITGEYRKFATTDSYFKEFVLTPNINFKGYRFSIGYAQQIQNIIDGQEKPIDGIYLGLSKYFQYDIGIFIDSQYLNGTWQYDVNLVKHFYKPNLSLAIGYERINIYDEFDISLGYRINY